MDGNLPGMMTGVVPAPAPAPKVPSLRASRQRAHGVDGMMTMTTIGKAGKAGKAGEVVDTTKRKIAVGARVSILVENALFYLWTNALT